MFLTYLSRELRRRFRQSTVISLGLALGIGLVITVSAVSSGLQEAQRGVLRGLYGVGTDITVTQARAAGSSAQPSPRLFARPQFGPMPATTVAGVAGLTGVADAAGGLTLTELKVSRTGVTASPSAGGGSPAGSFTTNTVQVSGVDPAVPGIGVLRGSTVSAGRGFTPADADAAVAVLDSAYASQLGLRIGAMTDVGGTPFQVIGTVTALEGGGVSDVYIPLRRAQGLAKLPDQVNIIYVSAASPADVDRVQAAISALLPAVTVSTSSDFAGAISGSLANASSLADNLGRWLAVAVLAAAFLVSTLLTTAAVSRRVREFGTLKALGWPSRRIIGQVMGESMVMGVCGAVAGVALGYGGAALVAALAPTLSASVGTGGGSAGRSVADTTSTVEVTFTAPVTAGTVALAVLLAMSGALVAGSFGGWRAARLRPAAALARVG
jgi:ABC-type lipoprotein release transport system permease subunit